MKYVPLLEKTAAENRIPFKAVQITTKEQAQQLPSPCTTYTLFHDGKCVSVEQMDDAR